MECKDPVLVYTNDKGSRQFRHFSLSNPLYKSMAQQRFDCGKCVFCRKRKAYELAVRCVLHASLYDENCFVTLTYDEKKIGYHNKFCYKDIQDFKKRLRQLCWRKHGKRVDVFNVHEYGKNGKKHWHLIVFNHDFKDKVLYGKRAGIPYYSSKKLEDLWPHGYNCIGDVSEASALYQASYMKKDVQYGNSSSIRRSHSKHSGLGRPYFLRHYRQLLSLGYIPFNGYKCPLPRYFEKLAHKHWAHFCDFSYFVDTKERKRVYTPFMEGEASMEIAMLWNSYKLRKDEKVKELEVEWSKFLANHLKDLSTPDFVKAADNYVHDLKNKPKEGF